MGGASRSSDHQHAAGSNEQQQEQASPTPRPLQKQPRILISGGSIAGLAAAAALATRGFTDVHVFEAREVLGGAGRSNSNSIWPSGVRALRAISPGLADEVLRNGARFGRRLLCTAAGETIQDSPAQYFEKYGEPALMIQWSQLHKLLQERVPKHSVRRRTSLKRFARAPADGGVDAVFTGPDGQEEHVHGDVLLGCDGIRSVVRKSLLGLGEGETEPVRDANFSVLSTTLPRSALPEGACPPETSVNIIENGRMGMLMDLGLGMAGVNIGARSDILQSLSHLKSKKERFAALAAPTAPAEGHGGWPIHAAVALLLEEDNIREDKLIDRPPLEPERLEGAGPVTLVGDALHLMAPSLGFGGVCALEGGLEVAQCLASAYRSNKGGEEGVRLRAVEAALRRYERARLERATAVQLQSFSHSSKWAEKHRKQQQENTKQEEEEQAAKQLQVVGAGVGGGPPSSGASGGDSASAGAASAPAITPPAPTSNSSAAAPPRPKASELAAGKFGTSDASALVLPEEFTDWLHNYKSPWGEEGGDATSSAQEE